MAPAPVETAPPTMPQSEQERMRMIWEKTLGHPHLSFRHEKTSVLQLSWGPGHDDLETGEEVKALRDVFEGIYGFKVRHKLLDAHKPRQQALKELSEFVYDEDAERALLIIYYAGHGHGAGAPSGDLMMQGSKLPDENLDEKQSVLWSKVETALKGTEADVLLIFDCCNAGRLSRPMRDASPKTSFQFLGACSEDQTTRGPSRESFTSALIWALKELANKDSTFSTAELRDKIMMYPHFPDEQVPVLSNRQPPYEHIAISKVGAAQSPAAQVPTKGERQLDLLKKEHVDLRFHFDHPVKVHHIEEAAEAMKRTMKGVVPWSRIAFIEKSSIVENVGKKWQRLARTKSMSKAQLVTPVSQNSGLTESLCGPMSSGPMLNPLIGRPPPTPALSLEIPQHLPRTPDETLPLLHNRVMTARRRRMEDEPISVHIRAIMVKLRLQLSAGFSWIANKLLPCSVYDQALDDDDDEHIDYSS